MWIIVSNSERVKTEWCLHASIRVEAKVITSSNFCRQVNNWYNTKKAIPETKSYWTYVYLNVFFYFSVSNLPVKLCYIYKISTYCISLQKYYVHISYHFVTENCFRSGLYCETSSCCSDLVRGMKNWQATYGSYISHG